MPSINVVFYQEQKGDAPVIDWLQELHETDVNAYRKCRAAIARLAFLGHEPRRPETDYLCDGIYELRIRSGSVNYRLLYFFHGRSVSVVAHGLTKEAEVPRIEINRAIKRKDAFNANPTAHTFKGDIDHA